MLIEFQWRNGKNVCNYMCVMGIVLTRVVLKWWTLTIVTCLFIDYCIYIISSESLVIHSDHCRPCDSEHQQRRRKKTSTLIDILWTFIANFRFAKVKPKTGKRTRKTRLNEQEKHKYVKCSVSFVFVSR